METDQRHDNATVPGRPVWRPSGFVIGIALTFALLALVCVASWVMA